MRLTSPIGDGVCVSHMEPTDSKRFSFFSRRSLFLEVAGATGGGDPDGQKGGLVIGRESSEWNSGCRLVLVLDW